jgi:putative membrane protein
MWWPVLSPISELPRLNPPLQMAYLFMQSLLPAVMASFITFSDTVVYSYYEDAPRIWGMSALADQQVAGGAMKLLGTLILWSYMTVVFFRWYSQEEAEEKEPRWNEVEAELEQMGLQQSR